MVCTRPFPLAMKPASGEPDGPNWGMRGALSNSLISGASLILLRRFFRTTMASGAGISRHCVIDVSGDGRNETGIVDGLRQTTNGKERGCALQWHQSNKRERRHRTIEQMDNMI